MNNVHINGWSDLKPFGVNPLTGEACKLSMRILCDLSENGTELMCDFLGLQYRTPATTVFAENWNSMVGDAPAVASVMIPRGLFDDLCRFAIFTVSGYKYALKSKDGTWHGYGEDFVHNLGYSEEKLFATLPGDWYRNPKAPAEGSRNVHQFTGRTE